MQLEWPLDRCAFCLTVFGEGEDHPHRRTDAHVIPRSLGGNLSTTALCSTCNSRTGTQFEGSLPLDPRLRAEIEKFADVLPEFAEQQTKAGRRWVARADDAVFRMKLEKPGEWRMMDSPQADGSRFKDTNDAVVELAGRLSESGLASEEVERALEEFKAGNDVRVGEWTFRPLTGDLELERAGDPADERAFLSIATHFLACALGGRVLMDDLEPVRRVLSGEHVGHSPAWMVVPQHADRESAPWHRLMVVQGEPFVIVDVCLFGRSRYLVLFLQISWSGSRDGVLFDLGTGALQRKTLYEPASA